MAVILSRPQCVKAWPRSWAEMNAYAQLDYEWFSMPVPRDAGTSDEMDFRYLYEWDVPVG